VGLRLSGRGFGGVRSRSPQTRFPGLFPNGHQTETGRSVPITGICGNFCEMSSKAVALVETGGIIIPTPQDAAETEPAMSNIFTPSEMNLSTTIRAARNTQRPWTLELTTAIIVAQDRLSRVARNSENYGRALTLAKIRQAERRIKQALRTEGGAA
jgi:hypothetical protein